MELSAVSRASEHLAHLLPEGAITIERILSRAVDQYSRLPGEAPTLLHGDFKLDHLWASRAGLNLIDFDSSRLGDPGADIGKLLADLRWWFTLMRRPGLEAAQRAFLEGYGAAGVNGRLARARLWEALLLAR